MNFTRSHETLCRDFLRYARSKTRKGYREHNIDLIGPPAQVKRLKKKKKKKRMIGVSVCLYLFNINQTIAVECRPNYDSTGSRDKIYHTYYTATNTENSI